MDAPDTLETPEYRSFTSEEQTKCERAYKLFLEENIDFQLAWRNAVAAILQEQRMTGFHPTAKQYREMFFWEKEYIKQGMLEDQADQMAWKRIMRGGK